MVSVKCCIAAPADLLTATVSARCHGYANTKRDDQAVIGTRVQGGSQTRAVRSLASSACDSPSWDGRHGTRCAEDHEWAGRSGIRATDLCGTRNGYSVRWTDERHGQGILSWNSIARFSIPFVSTSKDHEGFPSAHRPHKEFWLFGRNRSSPAGSSARGNP